MWKKSNKRRFAKANKQINISHIAKLLKASFPGEASKNIQVSHDRGVLKAYATGDVAFTP